MTLLLVMLGAAVGAPCRLLIDRAVTRRVAQRPPPGAARGRSPRWSVVTHPGMPWGILTANLIGSFVLGVVWALCPAPGQALLGAGFCGALTTYSTFAHQTTGLARSGAVPTAVAYVVISVAGCVALAFVGGWLVGAVAR